MAADFTTAEKQRVMYHLGYPAVTSAASIQFGMPAATQTNFLVVSSLNNLLESGKDQVREIVAVMDGIEKQMISAQSRLRAEKLEDLTLRQDETDALEGEYRRWGYRLSDILGAPIYPYSARYRGSGGNTVSSVPIRRSN